MQRRYSGTSAAEFTIFGWVVKNNKFLISNSHTEHETLVKKVETDLKNYITNSLKTGDRMPPHFKLAKQFNVSIKTIHDALQTLIQDGILLQDADDMAHLSSECLMTTPSTLGLKPLFLQKLRTQLFIITNGLKII